MDNLVTALASASSLLEAANRDHLYQAITALSMRVVEYENRHGTLEPEWCPIPCDNLDEVLLDKETEVVVYRCFSTISDLLTGLLQEKSGDDVVH